MTNGKLEQSIDELAEVQKTLIYVVSKRVRGAPLGFDESRWLKDAGRRLKAIPARFGPPQPILNDRTGKNTNSLADDLRDLAQEAAVIMGRVEKAAPLADPLRTAIMGRIPQRANLDGVLAHTLNAGSGNPPPRKTKSDTPS
ncbi:MAG: hypothetical protein ACE145_20550 [Terriglobia bacterium]